MKALRWLDKHAEETVMILLMICIVFSMGAQVIMRYIVGRSLPWPEEISRYMFIWMSMLAMSYAIRNDSSLKIDIIENVLGRWKVAFNLIGDLIYLSFCCYLVAPGASVLVKLVESNQLSSATLTPMWIVYLSLQVSLILSIFRLVQKWVLRFLNRNRESEV